MLTGLIGVYTGIKPEAFSISFNARSEDHMNVENWMHQAELVFEGGNDLSWGIRDVMTNCKDFDCAFEYMKTYPSLSPGYIIMAGVEKNEGAVISRARDGPAFVD